MLVTELSGAPLTTYSPGRVPHHCEMWGRSSQPKEGQEARLVGMGNMSELLINVVNDEDAKRLTGINQKVKVAGCFTVVLGHVARTAPGR